MWQPDKAQWRTIWIAVIVGLFSAGLAYNNGLDGYATFGVVVFIGALRVWQLQGKRQNPKPKPVFCGECGEKMGPDWKHCPACGSRSWKASQ